MSDLILAFLFPAVLVAFYIVLNWPAFQNSRILQFLIGLGVLLYFSGLVFDRSNPSLGSLLRLAGALLFVVLIVYQAIKRRK